MVVVHHVTIGSNWAWVVEGAVACGNRLHSTHCIGFFLLKTMQVIKALGVSTGSRLVLGGQF